MFTLVTDSEGVPPPPDKYSSIERHVRGFGTFGLSESSSDYEASYRVTPISLLRNQAAYVLNEKRALQLYDDDEHLDELQETSYFTPVTKELFQWALNDLKHKNPEKYGSLVDKSLEDLEKDTSFLETFKSIREYCWENQLPIVGDTEAFDNFSDYIRFATIPLIRPYEGDEQVIAYIDFTKPLPGRHSKKAIPDELMSDAESVVNNLILPVQILVYSHALNKMKNLEKIAALRGLTSQYAHDINNAAAAAMGEANDTQLALRDKRLIQVAAREPVVKQTLGKVYGAITKMRTAMDSITDLVARSRQSVAVDEFKPQRVELNDQIRNYALPAPVTYELDPEVDGVFIDKNLIYRAVQNAVTNSQRAIERHQKEHPGLKPEITIATSVDDDSVNIRVRDNGIGMLEEELAKANKGESFTSKTGGEGTYGLGIGIIHTAIKEHDGTVTYESERKRGTTLTMRIPYRKTLE